MIIIPARLNSSRFKNKILVDILGLPMVIRTAKAVASLDDVVIATDSQEVMELAKAHNVKAVLTSSKHQSGTDRINEAVNILNLDDQSDEEDFEQAATKRVNEAINSILVEEDEETQVNY